MERQLFIRANQLRNSETITQELSGSEETKIRLTKETNPPYSFHKIQIRD